MIKKLRNALCLLICLSLLALCGCNKQNTATMGGADEPTLVYKSALAYASHGIGEQDVFIKNSLNLNKMDSNSVEHLPIFKFESVQELNEFKTTILGSYNLNSTHNDVPSFNAVTKNYNDEFFKSNTVFLISIPATSGSVRHFVKDVQIKDGNLCVSVDVNSPNAVTMDLVSWFILVSVDNKYIENVTSFDAVYLGV